MKSTKNSDKIQNVELFHSHSLSSDEFLRKIFIVGYNSKALNKSLAKSISFDKEANKIIDLIESKEITIRSCGPLLLGLVRIYDRIVKNLLEDVQNILVKKEDKKGLKTHKTKELKDVIEEETMDDTEARDKVAESKRPYETSISNYMLTSPLKHGIYSLLADQTPSRFRSNLSSEKKDLSIEAFRGDISAESNYNNSEQKITSEIRINKTINNIKEETIFEENQGDFRNFFQIISGDKKKEGDLIQDLLESETKVNYHLEDGGLFDEIGQMEIRLEDPKFEDEKQLKFSSEIEEKLEKLRIKSKKMKYKFAFPLDEKVSLDCEKILKSNEDSTTNNESPVQSYLRMRMIVDNKKYDFVQILNNFRSEKGSISNYLDDKILKETSLDFNDSKVNTSNLFNRLDEEFSMDFLKTKDKILEQVKEKKEDIFPENYQDDMKEDQYHEEINVENNENLEEQKAVLHRLNEETKEILRKRKKGIGFIEFTEKIKENIEKVQTADVLYNSLIMAQNMEIEINQAQYFDNTSILLKINK